MINFEQQLISSIVLILEILEKQNREISPDFIENR